MNLQRIFVGFFFLTLVYSGSAWAQFDDLYYNPDQDAKRWAQTQTVTTQTDRNQDRQEYTQNRSNQNAGASVNNHYYDDYNYYYYSSRIRRFHRPYRGFDYFSSCYTDRYFYDGGFYRPGLSIYIGFNSYSPYSTWSNWHYRPYRYRYWNQWDYWHNPWYYNYGGPYVVNNYYYGNPYGYYGNYYGGNYWPGHYYYYDNNAYRDNDRGYYYGPRTTGSRTTPRDGRRTEIQGTNPPAVRETPGQTAPNVNSGRREQTENPGVNRDYPTRRTEPSRNDPSNQGRTNEPPQRPEPNRTYPNTQPNNQPPPNPQRGGRTEPSKSPNTKPAPNKKPSNNSGNNQSGRRQDAAYDRSDINRAMQRAADRDRSRSIFGNRDDDDRSRRRTINPFKNTRRNNSYRSGSNRSYNRSSNQRSVRPSNNNSSSKSRSVNRSSRSSSSKSSGRKSSSGGRRN